MHGNMYQSFNQNGFHSGNSFPSNTFNSFYQKISLKQKNKIKRRRKIEIQKAFKVINRVRILYLNSVLTVTL